MNFYNVLAAEKWSGGVPTINFFDLLFAQSMGGGEQWNTYEGTLPATINANGDDMRQYQVYGNTGGVGEEVDITGLSEPLCGIGTYTDSLDLSTGILTRKIKKLALTGNEIFLKNEADSNNSLYYQVGYRANEYCFCTHLANMGTLSRNKIGVFNTNNVIYLNFGSAIMNAQVSGNTVDGLKEYLAAQYAAGTPVTIWYVLANPEVSTITVPSGLTGIIGGYLIQDGTPTPETPIYPTANGVKQVDDTYSVEYGYKLDMVSGNTTTPIYFGSDPLEKDEYVDYQMQKVYRMINGALTPIDPPVPLPALPTADGETVVDYAGESVAPEKVVFEYAKGGS